MSVGVKQLFRVPANHVLVGASVAPLICLITGITVSIYGIVLIGEQRMRLCQGQWCKYTKERVAACRAVVFTASLVC